MKQALLLACYLLSFGAVLCQPTLGLIRSSPEAFPGYTLFSNNEETYLIDNCGLIVNQWHSDYRPGRAVYLLENGNLLRTAEQEGAFSISGRGGRFELFDWEGELLWSYEINEEHQQAHHDIAPLPNGNFLALVWENFSVEQARSNGSSFPTNLWSEAIYEIRILPNNDAEIVWEWHLWDHLIQDHDAGQSNFGTVAEHPERIDINYRDLQLIPSPNWVHLNSIDYHREFDQVVVSSRLFSEVWVIDHSTTTEEAAQNQGGNHGRGGDLLYRFGNPSTHGRNAEQQLRYQHDAQWIPEGAPGAGQLLVFNNAESAARSAIKSWTPSNLPGGSYAVDSTGGFISSPSEILYTADDFYSSLMSSVQVLPNGHLFICEGMSGHFFELDADKQIVWDYINPVNNLGGAAPQGAEARQNQVFRATRYPLNYGAFQGRLIEPTVPVEINPTVSDCFSPEPYMPDEPLELILSQNPVREMVHVSCNRDEQLPLYCFDALGRMLFESSVSDTGLEIDFSTFPKGIYWMVANDGARELAVAQAVKM